MKPSPSPGADASARPFVEWLMSGWRLWLVLAAALLVAYGPALRGEFLWDDRPGHVTRGELQSADGLRRIWFEIGATQQYYPVLHTAFWLEHRLWGDARLGYHVVNVLLHAAAAALLAALLRRLRVPGATTAAWLFALHPVCVESVAWISEQKNTLSAVLYLCAALAYLRFEKRRNAATYAIASAWFIAALLTKTITASLPAALLVLAWWRRGNIERRRDVLPLLPWLGLSLGAGLLTAWFEYRLIGAHGAEFARGVIERGLLPGRVLCFYAGKLLWPANLIFIYPRWNVRAEDAAWYLWWAVALAALITAWWWRRRSRAPLAVALLFAGTLFPVVGLLNVYPFRYSFVADHFQYLAILAPIAAFAAVATQTIPQRRAWVLVPLLVVATGLLTRAQSGTYRDPFTLYTATLARNPDSWMAHHNLAEALAAAGRPADAVPHLEEALRLKPDFAEAENNLGDDLRRLNRPREAIPHLQRALALQPAYPEAHNNLGVALLATGDFAAGKAELEAALRLNPRYALARYNLGLACANSGDVASAARHFEQAVALQPDYAEAELNWAIALLLSRGFGEAAPHFERALALQPDSAAAHLNFGRALAQAGRLDDAVAQYRQAAQLSPGSADAHALLAAALRQLGRTDEAAVHAAEAGRLGRGRN